MLKKNSEVSRIKDNNDKVPLDYVDSSLVNNVQNNEQLNEIDTIVKDLIDCTLK